MKEYIKKVWDEYGILLVITSAVILLQMLIGVMLWERLPEQMVTQFDMNSEPSGYSTRAFTVFGMPVLMLALHWICLMLSCSNNQKLASADPRVRRLVVFVIPAVCSVIMIITYGYALGVQLDVGRIVMVFIGLILLAVGVYLPRIRQNYTTGIKLPWTLADEEIWDRTHRMAGPVWMIGGLALIVSVLVCAEMDLPVVILLAAVLAPVVYSLAIYMRKYRNKEN